jgi:L-threonylcarbamoyladenylate synthase
MTQTKVWNVDKNVDKIKNHPQLMEAATLLKEEEVVAFPTETVYGLGANAYSTQAVEKVFKAKGRPTDNPLIIHIAGFEDLSKVASVITESAKKLTDAFWPGPLTVVLPKKGPLSPLVTAGLDTVGIRMPDHPVALELIRLVGSPLAAPSANRSGKPSPTRGNHVLKDLDGKIAGLVDAGPTGIGVESTVVDCTTAPVTLLRPGGVTLEQLEQVLGDVMVDPALVKADVTPKSPGLKYKHYSPNAPVFLVPSAERLQEQIKISQTEGKKVGVLTTDEHLDLFKEADFVISCGKRSELETVAQNIYGALRQFDDLNVDLILSETFPNKGLGVAIMNRLTKAAGGNMLGEKD